MASDKEFEQLKREAEEHAFSVRQLIAQRTRLHQLFDAIGAFVSFRNGVDLISTSKSIATTQSQFYQEIYCLLVNYGKRGGYFVEFGACDGILLSNTLLLEREFGWTGILSEPMPAWQEALKQNRNCTIDNRCVWTETGRIIDLFEFENDQYLTESSTFEENGRLAKNVYSVATVTLADLLMQHNAPRTIDFLSMDVEGGEHAILSTFPFDEYRFNFISVELHREHAGQDREHAEEINQLMTKNGYKQVFSEASGRDGFYVPANTPN
jgi:FkbM family methyltransferase